MDNRIYGRLSTVPCNAFFLRSDSSILITENYSIKRFFFFGPHVRNNVSVIIKLLVTTYSILIWRSFSSILRLLFESFSKQFQPQKWEDESPKYAIRHFCEKKKKKNDRSFSITLSFFCLTKQCSLPLNTPSFNLLFFFLVQKSSSLTHPLLWSCLIFFTIFPTVLKKFCFWIM